MTGMADQLELIAAEAPKLTDRQAAVVQALQAAGHEGLDPEDAGAVLHAFKEGRWAHPRTDRCAFCARDGKAYLARLRDLGHAEYRRARAGQPGAWIAVGVLEPARPNPRGMSDEIPY